MLDVALRTADGSRAVDWQHVGVKAVPPLPVAAPLRTLLPGGLRRGSTVSVGGSVSLLLALLGGASAGGAWCALVNFPRISAEAAAEYGIDLRRLALVPSPGEAWTTVVGALLDAVDIVAARPPQARAGTGRSPLAPADVRRLAARARSKDAVLVPFVAGDAGSAARAWPHADVRLHAHAGEWSGIGTGTGRLRARQLTVVADGRGQAARSRSADLWLPAAGGGIDVPAEHVAGITPALAPDFMPDFTPGLAPVVDLAG